MFVRGRTNDRRVRNKSKRNTLFATTSHINDGVRVDFKLASPPFPINPTDLTPSTPSTFSPVTLSRTWLDVFDALDQWDGVSNFYAYHARELNTIQGGRRLCSPKVGHLVALRTGGVQLVHHIHHEEVDGFQGDEGKLWALTVAGGTAPMLVIGTRCAYNQLTGGAKTWSSMTDWTTKKDVTTPPARA